MDTPLMTIHFEKVQIPNSLVWYTRRWSEWAYTDEQADVYVGSTYFWEWRPGKRYIPYDIERGRMPEHIASVKASVAKSIIETRKEYLYISF